MTTATHDDILTGLNDAQTQAVTTSRGPLLVIAGPGSGKTRVIAHRAAYMVLADNVPPHAILAVTFTNKAAGEVRDRIHELTADGRGARSRPTASTFHSWAASVLRRHGETIGLPPAFSILDQQDQRTLVKQAIADAGYDDKRHTPAQAAEVISKAKTLLRSPGECLREAVDYAEEDLARIYQRYEELLRRNDATDFDGLLSGTYAVLTQNQQVLEQCQERHTHIMVDEFQDTNTVQYRLLSLMASQYRNIAAVGDPDQSIYGWRHAGPENISNFRSEYPEAPTVVLDVNYRSTPNILEAAEELINSSPHREKRRLTAVASPGRPVRKFKAKSPENEGRAIVREVQRLSTHHGIKPGECAVLYRVNSQAKNLEEACFKYSQPYRLLSGNRFYEKADVKDITAYLRLLVNPRDDLSLGRIINAPKRGIGKRSSEAIRDLALATESTLMEALRSVADAHEQGFLCPARLKPAAAAAAAALYRTLQDLTATARSASASDTVAATAEDTGMDLQTDADRLQQLVDTAAAFDDLEDEQPPAGLTALLERAALITPADELGPQDQALNLLTLHQAKGLEFEVVFIPGMEEGLLPHRKALTDPDAAEEEKRLCFVGITRAKRRLYLTWAAERQSHGGGPKKTKPSNYLDIIQGDDTGQDYRPTRDLTEQHTPRPGENAIHPAYGPGRITASRQGYRYTTLTVDFAQTGPRELEILQPPE